MVIVRDWTVMSPNSAVLRNSNEIMHAVVEWKGAEILQSAGRRKRQLNFTYQILACFIAEYLSKLISKLRNCSST